MNTGADSISDLLRTLGRQVRKYRQIAGMTQNDLSEKCGLYRTYLSHLENGSANPTLTALRDVAAALGVEPAELIREK